MLLLAGTFALHGQMRPPQTDFPIDALTRDQVINLALDRIGALYFNAEVAQQMVQAVKARQAAGAYSRISTAAELATTLVADLRAVSHDLHLNLDYSATPLPLPPPGGQLPPPSEEQLRQAKTFAQKENAGVRGGLRLDGNIGYIKLQGFFSKADMEDPIAAMMNTVANTDALLIDARQNFGGSPEGVAALLSYLFGPDPVHLNDIVYDRGKRVDQSYTFREIKGTRYGAAKPVYVITSNQTVSAGEEMTYDLQALKRAVVVGEVTAGGANPATAVPLNQQFVLIVPIGQAVNPATGRNWEGVGVQPDVSVPASSALQAAHLLALLNLSANLKDMPPYQRDEVNRTISTLLTTLDREDPAASQQVQSAVQLDAPAARLR